MQGPRGSPTGSTPPSNPAWACGTTPPGWGAWGGVGQGPFAGCGGRWALGPGVLCSRLGPGGGGVFCPCLPFSKQASLLGASEICRVGRPAPTICLCYGSVLSGWGVWLGAAPVFGEGPLLRRRLSCILTLEQLRSVPSRGTVPIGPQTWLGLGGPGGCMVGAWWPCVCVCVWTMLL